ncbi:zinc finger protein rotund-like [Melitaea cinxia]|uniref:zinc finger protein rotund-like n=1 Tax=Melitaea cinxia TaxID=113334 RepID=UPI0004EA2910|nr:zinc finger protein rotund-like [Melitaea cinxia]
MMEGRTIDYRPDGGGLDYHNSPLMAEIPVDNFSHIHRSIEHLRSMGVAPPLDPHRHLAANLTDLRRYEHPDDIPDMKPSVLRLSEFKSGIQELRVHNDQENDVQRQMTPHDEGKAYSAPSTPLSENGGHSGQEEKVFGSKADLQLHTQIHLREAKPYRCTQCPKAFANSSYLAQHSRIHLGIKPYRCEICQRKFTQLSHLQQHIRTHTGDKPYRCTQIGCTKAFSQLSNLQSHSRCHQTDKPFKCNSCYKCFAQEKDLLEHIPKHKESKHLKTHICQYCGKSYTQETYLSKHMNKHAERADKRPPISALGLSGLNRSLAAAAPTAAPFADHPYWPKVSPDSAAHMSDDGGYHQQRESDDHHEQQLQQQRALFAQHEAQEDRIQPPVSSAANSAFTPINSMAPHLNGLSHHSALQTRPYLYDPLHFQQGKQQPNSFPNQLISLHQIRNYAHQPSSLLPAEHILPHSLAHKEKQ